MSKTAKGTPPKLGMEIEANWPQYEGLSPAARAAFEKAAGSRYNGGLSEYQSFTGCSGPRSRHQQFVRSFYDAAPAHLHYPDGWDKGHDSGVEMRFDGPADNLAQAETLIQRASAWLQAFGFTQFAWAGTHVHLGHVAWCDEMFGKNTSDLLRGRAEAALWGYFATREAAIFGISAKHRVRCGSCNPVFMNGRAAHHPSLGHVSSATPIWALHNAILASPFPNYLNAGFVSGALQMRRKNLPTLEFRHFTGTHATTALLGYVRLLYAMFANATQVVTEENLKGVPEKVESPILVDPYKYTVADLKKEIEDPWLQKWIDLTVKNHGEPITDEISIETRTPTAVAAA